MKPAPFLDFWKNQSTPLHREHSPEYYNSYAKELLLLTKSRRYARVLDLGCGSGDLFEPLQFNLATEYVGVDFSPKMLGTFRQRYPEAELHEASVADVLWPRKFDLIFCNGVIQYLDQAAFSRLLENSRAMLDSGGTLVLGSIPLRRYRSEFLTGRLTGRPFNWKQRLRWLRTRWKPDAIGRWYEIQELIDSCNEHGFSSEIFGSVHYVYRVHAVLNQR